MGGLLVNYGNNICLKVIFIYSAEVCQITSLLFNPKQMCHYFKYESVIKFQEYWLFYVQCM